MARRSSRSNGVPAVAVVSGSIRTPDDPSALAVKLSIWETEVTMRADGKELGHWPAEAVAIKPIDAFSFEFTAEGDNLIFQPDNPDEFKEHPIVAGNGAGRRRKRKRSSKPAPEPQPTELRWDESTEAEANLRKKSIRAAAASKAKAAEPASATPKRPGTPKPERPSRKDRRAAARAAKESIAAAAAARKVSVPVVEYDTASAAPPRRAVVQETEPQVQPQKAQPKRRERPSRERRADSSFADMRHRAWIASLDFARRYDLFGLDRVPVNEALRGKADHAHTWDHRVAPKSGPGSFICTICGAIRPRS